MSTPLGRYRIMAYVTGVGLVLLVCVAMPLKYVADEPLMVAVVGTAHGWLYMFYLLATLNLAYVARWSVARTLGVMVVGTIPFAVFLVEPKVVATERRRLSAGAPVTAPTG